MKLTNLLNLTVLGTTLTITAVGCRTAPKGVTPIKGPRPDMSGDHGLNSGIQPISDGGVGSLPGNPGIPPTDPNNYAGWGEDRNSLKPQTVYFDFDKSAIKSSEQSKLDEVANFLKSNPADALRVEGNCDQRGTEEYNRSLGERRAFAAREYLVHDGIDPQKVVTLSNGEDKPAETGSGEAAWAKNRRDEFIVLSPPKP
jgi:peptidoglycan-associated lipoprotein